MNANPGIEEKLLRLKEETGWSWERMAQEFVRLHGGIRGVTGTTLFRYAKGESRPRNQALQQYVVESLDRLTQTEEALRESETQRERAEEALKKTEARYRVLYHNSPIMMHSIDRAGRLISVSDYWLEVMGYERDEVIGRKSIEFLAEESQRYAEEVILPEFFKMGSCRDVEYQFVKKNGELMDVLLTANAIRDEAGAVDYSLAVLLDVTERKKADKALRQQNEHLSALHETALDLMNPLGLQELLEAIVLRAGGLVGTAHGYIYLVNPSETEIEVRVGTGAFSRDVGYRVKRGVGLAGKVWQTGQPMAVEDYRTWPGRVPGERFDDLHAAVAVPLQWGSRVIGVIALTHLEEGPRFGKSEINILTQFATLASIALDRERIDALVRNELEERKRAEESLRESEEKWRSLVENAPDMIIVIDREGIIQFINRTVPGITIEEVIGRSVYDYVLPPEHRDIMKQAIERVFRTGETGEYEIVGVGPHGTTSLYKSRVSPIKRDGKIVSMTIITRDITEEGQSRGHEAADP